MRLALPFLAFLLAAGCSGAQAPTLPEAPDADLSVLFVGNSLTYANDLPGTVTTVAEALGFDVAVAMTAFPDFALEDHWNQGVGEAIRQLGADVVVMQQGPSSLPQNQLHLATWTDSLAMAVRASGGEPALLMVWPSLARSFAFDDVRDSYRNAAQAAGATFIPAGEALRALHRDAPELTPFGGDGFHPSVRGTVLAAYVVVGTLLGAEVSGLPGELPAGERGGRAVSLDEEAARTLQAVADSVVDAWREGPEG